MPTATAGALNRLDNATARGRQRREASSSCSKHRFPIVNVAQPGSLQGRTSGICGAYATFRTPP